jgi:hypothetical protein
MQAHDTDGNLIGTFEGKAGDQFGLIGTKIDLLLRDSHIDPDTEEWVYELTLRAHKPVDEFRIRIELPEHGLKNLISEVDDIRGG